jgi:hypothetical protein
MKSPWEQYQTVLKRLECKDEGVREDWEEDADILLSDLEWCKFKEHVNFEATFNDCVDVDCDVIAAEYPTDTEIIRTIERGADTDCEVLEDDTGEDNCSEKSPSVGEVTQSVPSRLQNHTF